jgi:hypothetical protein
MTGMMKCQIVYCNVTEKLHQSLCGGLSGSKKKWKKGAEEEIEAI